VTPAQIAAILALCERFGVVFDPDDWKPRFDLPTGWVAGWAGAIYAGVSPEGSVHT